MIFTDRDQLKVGVEVSRFSPHCLAPGKTNASKFACIPDYASESGSCSNN